MKTFLIIALALTSTAAMAAGCKEGEVGYFADPSNTSGEGREIAVVCHNGRFFAPSQEPVRHAGCKEGETNYWSTDGQDGNSRSSLWVCRNGQYVEQGATPTRAAPVARCPEGRVETFTSGGGEGSPSVTEVYVCKNGQLRRIR